MEKQIIEALNSDPNYKLKDDFAISILAQIKKRDRAVTLRNWLLLFSGSVLFVVISLLALTYFIPKEQAYLTIPFIKWVLLSSGLIAVIQALDHLVTPHKQIRLLG